MTFGQGNAMDLPTIIASVLSDLAMVARSEPNERLPKEEQIRCSIYASLRPHFEVVCAERGYASIDDGSRIECDLWAGASGGAPTWLEFKRCWSASGWVNKPPEQLRDWEADIDKLRQLPKDTERYFVLVGVFDCDPLCEIKSAHSGVAKNIRRFYPSQIVYSKSTPFNWREGDGLTCLAAWVWLWPSGQTIANSLSE
jgi:hypothetical protein